MTTRPIDVEAELADLRARREILAAVHDYARGLDRLMPDVQRRAFHDDAWVDAGTFAGDADAFVKYCQDFLGSMESSQHLLGQVDIRVQGDTATGEVYFVAHHRHAFEGTPTDLFVAGRYVDEYRDRGAGWKIWRRRLLVDWASSNPATDAPFRATPGLAFGGRGKHDFSNQRQWPR